MASRNRWYYTNIYQTTPWSINICIKKKKRLRLRLVPCVKLAFYIVMIFIYLDLLISLIFFFKHFLFIFICLSFIYLSIFLLFCYMACNKELRWIICKSLVPPCVNNTGHCDPVPSSSIFLFLFFNFWCIWCYVLCMSMYDHQEYMPIAKPKPSWDEYRFLDRTEDMFREDEIFTWLKTVKKRLRWYMEVTCWILLDSSVRSL